MSLEQLLRRTDIWRAGTPPADGGHGEPSGNATLDAELPGGGWPRGALTELLLERPGIGELQLLLPALARLARTGRWLLWVTPPHLPYAPALAAAGIPLERLLLVEGIEPASALWAMEQALRSGVCGAVLGWPQAPQPRQLRRLQLAAETGDALGFLFRPTAAAEHASPAALRLALKAETTGLAIRILKRRGGPCTTPLHWPRQRAVA